MPTGLSAWNPNAATDEAYTNRLTPAAAAARKALSVPSTLMVRAVSSEVVPVIKNARCTTTSAPANACSSTSGSRTSPCRYVIFDQPWSAGSKGRRATPITRATCGSSSRSGISPYPNVPVGPVTATVSPARALRAMPAPYPRRRRKRAEREEPGSGMLHA